MEKRTYNRPEFEEKKYASEDVLTTSNPDVTNPTENPTQPITLPDDEG